jgi:DNA-binding transcriptional LysR family regulator
VDRFAAMEVFARVVEAGSFAGAADRLGLSRAAASKQVMQLEAHLGARLLNRTTRRLSLTEEGAAYYERCLRILAELDDAERVAAEARGAPRGTLRLSAPLSFGILHLGPALSAFACRHQGVSLALTLDDRFVDLVEEGFDAAIRIGRLPDSTLVARLLCRTRLVVAAAPAYWREHGVPLAPAELARHRCLNYTLRAAGRDWRFADGSGGEETVAVAGPLTANNGDVLRAAALAGAGVAWLPDFLIGADVKAGLLETALDDRRGGEIGIYIVYPQTRHLTAKLRVFVDFLVEHFSAPPDWRLA